MGCFRVCWGETVAQSEKRKRDILGCDRDGIQWGLRRKQMSVGDEVAGKKALSGIDKAHYRICGRHNANTLTRLKKHIQCT